MVSFLSWWGVVADVLLDFLKVQVLLVVHAFVDAVVSFHSALWMAMSNERGTVVELFRMDEKVR